MEVFMDYSIDGLKLTEAFEGCRLKAYQDIVGVWTIGYGHTRNVKPGDVCTLEQAEEWLKEDVQDCVDAINKNLKVEVSQAQFDALVDFSFNLGVGALLRSTLWKKLQAGDYRGAANEFPKWDMAGGKHVAGLTRRRLAEQKMFLS